MSLITLPFTFTTGQIIVASQHNSDFSTIYTDYNGNITDANIASGAAISGAKLATITTAGKVSGAALTSLASIPSGAGIIPSANLPTVTPTVNSYVKCTNTQSQGVNGGSITTGSWGILTLNTKDVDTDSIATLSSNKITLPAGSYIVRSVVPLHGSGTTAIQTRLFNNSDSSVTIIGMSSYAQSGLLGFSFIYGYFTIAGAKDFYLQYNSSTSQATDGQGIQAGLGTEVYATIEFTKVS